eukprot:252480_1
MTATIRASEELEHTRRTLREKVAEELAQEHDRTKSVILGRIELEEEEELALHVPLNPIWLMEHGEGSLRSGRRSQLRWSPNIDTPTTAEERSQP